MIAATKYAILNSPGSVRFRRVIRQSLSLGLPRATTTNRQRDRMFLSYRGAEASSPQLSLRFKVEFFGPAVRITRLFP
jgi:hypothetical protein